MSYVLGSQLVVKKLDPRTGLGYVCCWLNSLFLLFIVIGVWWVADREDIYGVRARWVGYYVDTVRYKRFVEIFEFEAC